MKEYKYVILMILFIWGLALVGCSITSEMIVVKQFTRTIDTTGMTAAAKIYAERIPNAHFGKPESIASSPVHKMKGPSVFKNESGEISISPQSLKIQYVPTAYLPDKFKISEPPRSESAKYLTDAISGLNYLQKVVRAEKAHLVVGTYYASNLLGIDYDSRDSTLSINPNEINYLRITFGLTKKHPVLMNDFYYDLTIVIKSSSSKYELIWPDGMTITYMDKAPLYNLQTNNYDRLEMEILRMIDVMTSLIYKETIKAGLSTSEIGD